MMNTLMFKILKYLAIGMAIYLVFRFVPNVQLESGDILLISMVSIFAVLLLETLCSSYDVSEGMSDMCKSTCSVKEGMADMATAPVLVTAPIAELPKPIIPEVKMTEEEAKAKIYDYQAILKRLDEQGVQQNGSRVSDGTLNDERAYSSFHQLPMPDNYDKDAFEYGDSFLPPEKWYPQPPIPPVCVSEKQANVCPMLTTGAPSDVKEWNSSRRITGPDNINVKYVKDKLNSGR
jgi:hypothetical protein